MPEEKHDNDLPVLKYKMSSAGSLCIMDQNYGYSVEQPNLNGDLAVPSSISQEIELVEDTPVIKADNAFLSWQRYSDDTYNDSKIDSSDCLTLKNITLTINRGNSLFVYLKIHP